MDKKKRGGANLKKLQTNNSVKPKSSSNTKRTRSTVKNSKEDTVTRDNINNYFRNHKDLDQVLETNEPSTRNKLRTRTKLTNFIYKDESNVPDSIRNQALSIATTRLDTKDTDDSDDFQTPVKKIKRAPSKLEHTSENEEASKKSPTARIRKTKLRPRHRQPKITSALLRNEELFSEIAAQHCLAENFNPDDIQLALAISSSEADSKKDSINESQRSACSSGVQQLSCAVTEEELGERNDTESIHAKLQQYGFRTAAKEDYNAFTKAFMSVNQYKGYQRFKSKWANKFTALTLRNADLQRKKLNENIENFLNQQYNATEPLNDLESANAVESYECRSAFLRSYQNLDSSAKPELIQRVEITAEDTLETVEQLEKYFVKELFKASHVKAGHLLKNWSAIQGRDFSPCKKTRDHLRKKQIQLEAIYKDLEDFFKQLKLCSTSGDIESEVPNDSLKKPKAGQNQFHQQVLVKPPDDSLFVENDSLSGRTVISKTSSDSLKEGAFDATRLDALPLTAIVSECGAPESTATDKDDEIMDTQEPIEENFSENVSSAQNETVDLMIKAAHCIQPSTSEENASSCLTAARSNSPDLFADSDSDVEREAIIKNKDGDITVYELFTDDQVKTSALSSSMKTHTLSMKVFGPKNDGLDESPIVDLTQESTDTVSSEIVISKEHDLHNPSFDAIFDKEFKEMQLAVEEKTHKNLPEHRNAISEQMQITDLVPTINILRSDSNRNDSERKSGSNVELNFLEQMGSISTTERLRNENIGRNSEIHLQRRTKSLNVYSPNNSTLQCLFESIDLTQEDNDTDDVVDTQGSLNPPPRERDTSHCEDDENNDDFLDYIVLSDDEVNYSILKADKSKHSTNRKISKNESSKSMPKNSDDFWNLLSDDNEPDSSSYKSERHAKTPNQRKLASNDSFQTSKDHNFSIIDLIDMEKSFGKCSKSERHSKSPTDKLLTADAKESNLSDPPNPMFNYHCDYARSNEVKTDFVADDDIEPIATQYLATPSKIQHSNNVDYVNQTPILNRAEFGILESQSEYCTQTPVFSISPKRQNNSPCNDSFFLSGNETSLAVKEFRKKRSSSKFKTLLWQEEVEEPHLANGNIENDEEFDDFDEFDGLLHGTFSSFKAKDSAQNCNNSKNASYSEQIPRDLDKLLNAEISFEALKDLSNKNAPSHLPASSDRPETSKKSTLTTQNATEEEGEEEELIINDNVYVTRLSKSPKPNFFAYSDAELLKQLYNFGIKPLKRKQAISILEYIYNQTHPIILNAEKYVKMSKYPIRGVDRTDDDRATCSSKCQKEYSDDDGDLVSSAGDTLSQIKGTFGLKDCSGKQLLHYSGYLSSELSEGEEFYIFQTNITKKTARPLLPLHVAWFNLICSNQQLHEHVLMYEPIDLQEIFLFLKSIGYRYDPKDMKRFFDERCIIFRYDLTPADKVKEANSNRHVRTTKIQKTKITMAKTTITSSSSKLRTQLKKLPTTLF